MARRRLFWRFYLTLLALLAVGSAAVGALALWAARRLFVDDPRHAEMIRSLEWRVALTVVAVVAVAALLALVLTRGLSRPLENVRRGAERFARGDLSRDLPVESSDEVGQLAESLNQMASQLDRQIRHLARQRNQLQAVLSSMVEAVIAVDASGRILRANQAVAQVLGIDAAGVVGQRLVEVLPHPQIERLLKQVLFGGPTAEAIQLDGPPPRQLHAQGSVLRDASETESGVLLVLHDVTQLRRLESLRRDFVANVSHELKTPITAIKGFIETLRDGAIGDPEKAEHFLGIVNRQADRLVAIIDDLLALSRIEQEHHRRQIELTHGRVGPILQAAVQSCEARALARNIHVAVDCPQDLLAWVNAALLEQAVVNLIDNAVKYSDPGATVTVRAAASDTGCELAVIDTGCGIAAEHLPRLFERFYRVDKARSRTLGGTGLGLAIVKHIAQAHGGSIAVESTPGAGSTFTIGLPRRPRPDQSPDLHWTSL